MAQLRARFYLFLRRFRLTPVTATDENAAMHEFALLAGAANTDLGIDDVHLDVWNRSADRAHLRLERFGRQIGRPKRLGKSVHEKDLRAGEDVRHMEQNV